MSYYKSAFNFFVPNKDSKTIVFNSLSGQIGLLDEETMLRWNTDTLTDTEMKELLKRGVLVDDTFDETAKIRSDRNQWILQNKYKFYRIWTTSICNAQCYYCFESGIERIQMSEKTANEIVQYISNDLTAGDCITVEWFGGEPLLNTSVIDIICSKVKNICEKKNCIFSSHIITNGSLLSKSLLEKMIHDWNVKSVQVTLDGDEDLYNSIKRYNDDNYNFKVVINNIKKLLNTNVHVAIRMNYDTHNYNSLDKLISFLYDEIGFSNNLTYYIYPVWDALGKTDDGFTTNTEADTNMLMLLKKLVDLKMAKIQNVARLNYKKHQCNACSRKSITILPNGDICKCSETFTQILGNINQGITDINSFNAWIDTQLDSKCELCKFLPLCQGGCRSSKFTKMPQCYPFKSIFNDILRWYVEELYTEKARQN